MTRMGLIYIWASNRHIPGWFERLHDVWDLDMDELLFLNGLPETGMDMAKEALECTKDTIARLLGHYSDLKAKDAPYSECKELAFEIHLEKTRKEMLEDVLRAAENLRC